MRSWVLCVVNGLIPNSGLHVCRGYSRPVGGLSERVRNRFEHRNNLLGLPCCVAIAHPGSVRLVAYEQLKLDLRLDKAYRALPARGCRSPYCSHAVAVAWSPLMSRPDLFRFLGRGLFVSMDGSFWGGHMPPVLIVDTPPIRCTAEIRRTWGSPSRRGRHIFCVLWKPVWDGASASGIWGRRSAGSHVAAW